LSCVTALSSSWVVQLLKYLFYVILRQPASFASSGTEFCFKNRALEPILRSCITGNYLQSQKPILCDF
jgi:hypothetical protein